MENAADALKMVLGIFMFVLGLSLFFFMINQVKATSDVVLFMSDKTNFYDMDKLQSNSAIEDRIVGLETVIPNIYAYSRENTGITIIDKDAKAGYKFIRYSTVDDGKVKNDIDRYIEEDIKDKLKIPIDKSDIKEFYNNICFNGTNQMMWMGNPEDRAKRIQADISGVSVSLSAGTYPKRRTRNEFKIARKL